MVVLWRRKRDRQTGPHKNGYGRIMETSGRGTEKTYRERERRKKKRAAKLRRARRLRLLFAMCAVLAGTVFLAVKAADLAAGEKTSLSEEAAGPRETAEGQHVWQELPRIQGCVSVRPAGQTWSSYHRDNICALAPQGGYLTALRAHLDNQPESLTGAVEYSVNLSGSGWLPWSAADTELGDTSGDTALEAVSLRLTGELAEYYDILYCVLQNDAWTDWVMNGAEAGVSGAGLHVDGIRVSVVRRKPGQASFPGEIDPDRPMVALTYDDGPSGKVTPRILEKLEEHGAHATFFMVGERAEKCGEILNRMIRDGCETANHTYSHVSMNKLDPNGMQDQIGRTNDAVEKLCGVRPVLMRPVGGNENDLGLGALGAMGMPAILWSVDTLDWKTRDAASTVQAVRDKVQDGDIILMHDLYDATGDASMVIIDELAAQGYQLVTVSELSACRGGLKPGKSYTRFRPQATGR